MRIPVIQGMIDRRILVNFRVRPPFVQRIVPAPFRVKLINGWGMAGICLIRLKDLRPRHLPESIGLNSENATHRIAIEWDSPQGPQDGVYVVRRDSSSLFNSLAGGRLFPGVHHHARFKVIESETSFHVELTSDDRRVHVLVDATLTSTLSPVSIFHSLPEASRFFEAGSIGYSPSPSGDAFVDGLELKTLAWKVEPLGVRRVESSFFSDPATFPPGSAEFDSALLMRQIPHEWHDRGQMPAAILPNDAQANGSPGDVA